MIFIPDLRKDHLSWITEVNQPIPSILPIDSAQTDLPLKKRRKSFNVVSSTPPMIPDRRFSVDLNRAIKSEPQPIYSACSEHIQELETLFERQRSAQNQNAEGNDKDKDTDDDSSDDCIMMGETVPQPLPSTVEGLIKQENDVVSADKAFIRTVSVQMNELRVILIEVYVGNVFFPSEKWSYLQSWYAFN